MTTKPRRATYRHGNLRADALDAATRLVAEGHRGDLEALRPSGYSAWMAGGPPRDIQAAVVRETQAYAKRQATWFRHQLPEAPAWDPDAEPLAVAFARLGLLP